MPVTVLADHQLLSQPSLLLSFTLACFTYVNPAFVHIFSWINPFCRKHEVQRILDTAGAACPKQKQRNASYLEKKAAILKANLGRRDVHRQKASWGYMQLASSPNSPRGAVFSNNFTLITALVVRFAHTGGGRKSLYCPDAAVASYSSTIIFPKGS